MELRQLESSVAVRSLHDRNLRADTLEPHDAVHPAALDGSLALQLESELDEELNRGREVVNHDADVLHPLDSQVLDATEPRFEHERRSAHAVAREIGVPVVEVITHEGDRAAYRANDIDRCFHCKDELFATISDEVVAGHRLDAVAYGENADDAIRPDRPGARAASDHLVLRPLAAIGLTKIDVRLLARELGLSVAEKPAAPCLASRIPHGQEVTPEKLRQVEQAETSVRALGFSDLRVRHHGEIARLELPADDLVRAVTEPLRGQVLQAVRAAGFRFVALDLAGIQSGAFTLSLLTRDHASRDHASRDHAFRDHG